MGSCTYGCLTSVINIGNSIIGVSILAMPYCFRKCGILLSMVLILISGFLTRLACYLLLKSAIMARRRNFECLAFHTFGSSGKLMVEISVVGFLIGVCIAFFVVIGDLGPPLAAEFLEIQNSPNLRTNVLVLVGLCVALPLGMLRKIDSLTSLSALSIAFYGFLVLKIFSEATPNLILNEWWYEVNWWRSDGILPCLPIFSMALSCQTQLFEFFDTLNDPSLKRMQSVISGAVHLCSTVYILVGTFGYIAFHNKVITGNALILLTPSMMTEFIKLGFILTVAVSFPLCLFPCRSSLHSLIFKQQFGHHDIIVSVIPDHRFRILTVSLVMVTIGIAIMLPNIEFVLGIIGSTIGTLICLIFPAMMFIHDTSKNTSEKRLAQVLMCIGIFILVACTYSTLNQNTEQPVAIPVDQTELKKITNKLLQDTIVLSSDIPKVTQPPVKLKEESLQPVEKVPIKNVESDTKTLEISNDQKRLEPPVPQEPEAKVDSAADLDPQALQKEDKELQKDEKKSVSSADNSNKKKEDIDKQQQLLEKLEEQHKEQKLILEQQKQVLKELKLHKESHEEQKKFDLGSVAEKQDPKRVDKVSLPQKRNEKVLEKVQNPLVNIDKVTPSVIVSEGKAARIDNPESLKPEKSVLPNVSSYRNVDGSELYGNLLEKVQQTGDLRNDAPGYKNVDEKVVVANTVKPFFPIKHSNETLIVNIETQKLKVEDKINNYVSNASLTHVDVKIPKENENLNLDRPSIDNKNEPKISEKNNEAHIAKRETLENKHDQ